jgi:hypothetical protein
MRFLNVLLVLATVSLLIWGATHTPLKPRQASAQKILEHRGRVSPRGEHPSPRPAAWSADQFSIEFDRDRVE